MSGNGAMNGHRTPPPLPRVALLIETSAASGRDMLRGVARFVRATRRWTIVHHPGSRDDLASRWKNQACERGYDGVLARIEDEALGRSLARLPVPVVDMLGGGAVAGLPLVHVDHATIVRLALEHFLERGFRSLGFVSLRDSIWAEARGRAFLSQTRTAKVAASVLSLAPSAAGDDPIEREDGLRRWLRSLPKPVGVLACFDPTAREVLEAARREGFDVPADVAVVGIDDDEPLCELASPALSSVDANHVMVGYRAAELLDAMLMGDPPPSEPIFVPPARVVVRSSSDVLAAADPHLSAALRFIREHACHGIGVDEVARHVALSRSVLGRRFRAELGRSVYDEIVRVRVAQIRELLARDDLPIKVVAERTGFDVPEQFSRYFRLHTGRSPTEYRRNVRSRSSSEGRG